MVSAAWSDGNSAQAGPDAEILFAQQKNPPAPEIAFGAFGAPAPRAGLAFGAPEPPAPAPAPVAGAVYSGHVDADGSAAVPVQSIADLDAFLAGLPDDTWTKDPTIRTKHELLALLVENEISMNEISMMSMWDFIECGMSQPLALRLKDFCNTGQFLRQGV